MTLLGPVKLVTGKKSFCLCLRYYIYVNSQDEWDPMNASGSNQAVKQRITGTGSDLSNCDGLPEAEDLNNSDHDSEIGQYYSLNIPASQQRFNETILCTASRPRKVNSVIADTMTHSSCNIKMHNYVILMISNLQEISLRSTLRVHQVRQIMTFMR